MIPIITFFPMSLRAAAGRAYSINRLMSGLMLIILLPVLQTVVATVMLIVILDVALLAPSTMGSHWTAR
ncbi:hypothetical protein COJ46_01500 [Bacillus sp. AFS077874]|nr:hypothetical protein CN514_02455 [Bacillus sp. AFS001701]PFM83222.1 hypothetical protein COJ46_01500 [Bacillus sp. AFS077874]